MAARLKATTSWTGGNRTAYSIALCIFHIRMQKIGSGRASWVRADAELTYQAVIRSAERVMSAQSLAELRRRGYARVEPSDHRILLNADGRCRFKSYWE